ncbi:MAG TPA: hypothetical protein VMT30_09355 [Candidatus Saccharimonadia bacterium]|nr:hypothetical protein [Candidatus Saccharimonadia bacterium]
MTPAQDAARLAGAVVTVGQRISEHGAKVAAGKLRITVAAYRQHEANGEAWCTGHQDWHSRTAFHVQVSRPNGLQTLCRQARSELDAERRVYVLATDHQRRIDGITYAGPAFARRRHSPPTPEGAASVTSVGPQSLTIGEIGHGLDDAAGALSQHLVSSTDAVPSGHIYHPASALTAQQLRQAAATADLLGVPVGVLGRKAVAS